MDMPYHINENVIFLPSSDSIIESERLATMCEVEIIREYLNYPLIPYNEIIKIDKIAILNFHPVERKHLGIIRYGQFRAFDPVEFYECKDPKLDYEDADQVSPAIIISNGMKYRTPQVLWYPLSDVVSGIQIKQSLVLKTTGYLSKLLPIEVFIDDKNQWMVRLFNLVGMNILEKL